MMTSVQLQRHEVAKSLKPPQLVTVNDYNSTPRHPLEHAEPRLTANAGLHRHDSANPAKPFRVTTC
jgi:hypothetical protein